MKETFGSGARIADSPVKRRIVTHTLCGTAPISAGPASSYLFSRLLPGTYEITLHATEEHNLDTGFPPARRDRPQPRTNLPPIENR